MSKAHPRFRRNNAALPPAVPNLFEVLIIGGAENAETVNTFYYADGGAALVPGTEQNIINGWQAAFQTTFLAACSADWVLASIKCQCLTSPARMPVKQAVLVGGTGPAGHEPLTVAATIQRITGVKGQSGRGRVSMPAVPSAWVTASLITNLAAYNAWAADVATGFVAAGVTYVAQLVSRGNRAGPPLGASPILRASVDNVLGSARRRKINR